MSSEYVRISATENYFGQKNLLRAQLEFLDSLRRIQRFRKLREEELALKLSLKTKTKEAFEDMEKLNRVLPVSHYQETYEQRVEARKKKEKQEKHSVSLEGEIAEIQEKLARLQSGN